MAGAKRGGRFSMADNKAKPGAAYSPSAVHMMRQTQHAQMQLSGIADAKANILMGATFVIFTITVGQSHDGPMPLPLLILGGAAFFSAILAVLAVIPKVGRARSGTNRNLLFFGEFTEMDQEAFVEELTGRLKDDDTLFRTMARDIYQNGQVLRRKKYRLLGLAYQVFLLGLVGSCAAFVIHRYLS
jgi:hypothetical protein